MKAAVLPGPRKLLEIQEVPDPTPSSAELIVKVQSCGICGSDLHVSDVPFGMPPGMVMGHEFSGVVAEVGKEAAARFEVGDRVCALPMIGCGHCAACLTGDGTQCATIQTTGLGQIPGAYAEYVRVGMHETLRLPDSVDHRQGAMVEPLAVGLHAVEKAGLQPGARVLVVGGGPIGLTVALWSRFFGARAVVMSEKAHGRRELAAKFGATDALDPTREEVGPEFAKRAGGPPDVVFECVGVPGLIQECMNLAPNRGRVVVVGVCVGPDTFVPAVGVIKELDLRFVVAYHRRDWELTLSLLDQRRISSHAMVTDVVDLAGFPAAFQALKTPSTQCKVILEP
ncbi:MAG TPA: alcohol dehydrogenase catalytic domain-containing protein [Myxococcota bacterium]|jgi:2-desacetyl-2-hydroxyethyl bacteriochlorophyllide A dehydrogenase|nr:alcohol dehydrogenase catalytic domain-containing protein [Myxococcota bacterium]